CGSERSGIASSGICLRAASAPRPKMTNRKITNQRFLAQRSMSLPIIAERPSPPGLRNLIPAVLLHGAHAAVHFALLALGPFVRVLRVIEVGVATRRRSRRGGRSRSNQRGLQAALRVEQERGPRDDALSLGQPAADNELASDLRADLDRGRRV